jgi:hypothetical protein
MPMFRYRSMGVLRATVVSLCLLWPHARKSGGMRRV